MSTAVNLMGSAWQQPMQANCDHADNPTFMDADYLMAQVTFPLKPAKVSIGYEVCRIVTEVFKTPLATLHKFQGWADKFLGTPANGVKDSH